MFASEFVTTQFKYIASMSFVLGKKTHTGIYILSSSSIGDLNFAMNRGDMTTMYSMKFTFLHSLTFGTSSNF